MPVIKEWCAACRNGFGRVDYWVGMTFQVAFQVLFQMLVMLNSVQCHIALERAEEQAAASALNCSLLDEANASDCARRVAAEYALAESKHLASNRCHAHVFAPLLTGVLVLFALLGITKELFVLIKSVRVRGTNIYEYSSYVHVY